MSTLTAIVLVLMAAGYQLGRRRALRVVGGNRKASELHSRPSYYGTLTALWCGVPALLLVGVWLIFKSTIVTEFVLASASAQVQSLPKAELNLFVNDVFNVVSGNVTRTAVDPEVALAAERYLSIESIGKAAVWVLTLCIAMLGVVVTRSKISVTMRARNHVERFIVVFLVVSSTVAVFTTVGIVLSVLFEAIRFFQAIPMADFLFGIEWSPQTAIRADQVGSSGAFGAVPLFTGTLLISFIAMLVAVPIGLMSAVYLTEYADKRVRAVVKPLLEILAGVPTVVYGFFAALTVAPFFRDVGAQIGLDVASESALAAGVVMGIMIIPFVSSLSDDVINAVPQSLRDGAFALGATSAETVRQVIFPAALPGIVGGVLLAVSRAIGETMIVVMAAGLAANLTANPLEAVTTVTAQIVTLLVGDQEFDSPKTLAAFALGLMLFVVTLILNVIALHVVRKYREQYD
jgi:phosphate transport system permease protein